jgi:hypothetical protein
MYLWWFLSIPQMWGILHFKTSSPLFRFHSHSVVPPPPHSTGAAAELGFPRASLVSSPRQSERRRYLIFHPPPRRRRRRGRGGACYGRRRWGTWGSPSSTVRRCHPRWSRSRVANEVEATNPRVAYQCEYLLLCSILLV